MSKPALGRGLGDLLKGTKVEVRPPPAPLSEAPVTPGLRRLLDGKPTPTPPKPWQKSAPPLNGNGTHHVLPGASSHFTPGARVLLLAADAMLLFLCASMAYKDRGAMGVIDAVLCVAGVSLAGALGVMALRLRKRS